MDAMEQAKLSLDAVVVHHDTKLTLKVGDKNVTIAYREVRPGHPDLDILFLHGASFKSQTWVSEPLKTLQLMYNLNYRAVAIDLPGYGDSPNAKVDSRELLGAVIATLKLNKPVIVSPSMSGGFSLPYLFGDTKRARDMCRAYVPVAPVNTESYTVDTYRAFEVPTLLMYGSRDTRIGPTAQKNLSNIPNTKVVEIHDAGHACYMNKPDEFHRSLQAFLSSLKD